MSFWHILFADNFYQELSLLVKSHSFASGICLGEKIGNFIQLNRLILVSPKRKVDKDLLLIAASSFGEKLAGFFFLQTKVPFFPLLENRLALKINRGACNVYHCQIFPEKTLTLLRKIKIQEEA